MGAVICILYPLASLGLRSGVRSSLLVRVGFVLVEVVVGGPGEGGRAGLCKSGELEVAYVR